MKLITLVTLAVPLVVRVGAAQVDPRADLFVRRGCSECHAISALRVKASSDVAPDLTFAYADVMNRYGINLESFLNDPRGVMRLMLASHLRLTVADRDSMVHILRGLYVERRADMDQRIPSLPPGKAGQPSFVPFSDCLHKRPPKFEP